MTKSDSKENDRLNRVESLETHQAKSDDKLIDLQWRSIKEKKGVFENVELSLRHFLRNDIKIDKPIEFDRVHRLGRYEFGRKYPRPIIAKFERFKDKEYVRQSAPEALYGTKDGVREQYPQKQRKNGSSYIQKQRKLDRTNIIRCGWCAISFM